MTKGIEVGFGCAMTNGRPGNAGVVGRRDDNPGVAMRWVYDMAAMCNAMN